MDLASDDAGAPLARVTHGLGVLLDSRASPTPRCRLFERSLAIWRDLGDRDQQARELNSLGITHFHLGHLDTARSLLEDSIAIAREIGSEARLAAALTNLGQAGNRRGQLRPRRAGAAGGTRAPLGSRVTRSAVAIDQLSLALASLRAGRAREARDMLSAHVRLCRQLRRHRVPGQHPGAVRLHRRGAWRWPAGGPPGRRRGSHQAAGGHADNSNPTRPCWSGSWPRPAPPSPRGMGRRAGRRPRAHPGADGRAPALTPARHTTCPSDPASDQACLPG